MNIFHKHNWKEIAKTYEESEVEKMARCGLQEIKGYRVSTNSYTTILWECKICQKIRKEVLLGKE